METINTPHPVLSIPDEREMALAAELARLRAEGDPRVMPAPRRVATRLRAAFAVAPHPTPVLDR
jgi:hypothetical protein